MILIGTKLYESIHTSCCLGNDACEPTQLQPQSHHLASTAREDITTVMLVFRHDTEEAVHSNMTIKLMLH